MQLSGHFDHSPGSSRKTLALKNLRKPRESVFKRLNKKHFKTVEKVLKFITSCHGMLENALKPVEIVYNAL